MKRFLLILLLGFGVQATAAGPPPELWGNKHDRDSRFRSTNQPGHLIGPVVVDNVGYYSLAQTLYLVTASTGAIQKRILLPGYATQLKPQPGGAGILVQVKSVDSKQTWTRSYKVGPDSNDVPFFLPSSLLSAMLSRKDAQATPTDQLEAMARKDPTNPWYFFELGKRRFEAGQKAEALEAFRAALSLDPAYDYELMAMALKLDGMAPELGDEAFNRGLAFLLGHGFEPKLMTSLIGLMTFYGRPDLDKTDAKASLPRLQQLANRLERLAPRVEGAAYFFQAVAKAARKAGQPEAAKHWEKLAQDSLPYRMFGMGGNTIEWAGFSMNVFWASIAAALLVIGTKFVRNARQPKPWAFFSWNRSELIGLLALYPLIAWSGLNLSLGVRVIGIVAAMPLGATLGNFGHPDAMSFCAQLQGSEEGDFINALAFQQAGDKIRAATIYSKLSLPEAQQNIAVLESKEPGAALAIPDSRSWDKALRAFAMHELSLSDLFQILEMLDSGDGYGILLLLNDGFLVFLGVAGFFALRALFHRQAKPQDTLIGRLLELLVPGTARPFGLLGPIFLASGIFSSLISWSLQETQGMATNILEGIAAPNLTRALGAAAPIQSNFELAIRQVADWVWVVLALNAAVILLQDALRLLRRSRPVA